MLGACYCYANVLACRCGRLLTARVTTNKYSTTSTAGSEEKRLRLLERVSTVEPTTHEKPRSTHRLERPAEAYAGEWGRAGPSNAAPAERLG